MKRDMVALEMAIRDKIRKSTFQAIVTECFMGALPFDGLEYDDKLNLSTYVGDVMESLTSHNGAIGGLSILEKNIAQETNPAKQVFYSKIYNICNEAATSAAQRIVKDSEGCEKSLEEILDNSGLNEEELKDFKDNVETLNVDNMTDVIQQKVIDTIKLEQEQQKTAADLNQKLRDAIAPEPSEEELADRDERLSMEDDELDDDLNDVEDYEDDDGVSDDDLDSAIGDEPAQDSSMDDPEINPMKEEDGIEENPKKKAATEGLISYAKGQRDMALKVPQARKRLENMSENEYCKVFAEYAAGMHGAGIVNNLADIKKAAEIEIKNKNGELTFSLVVTGHKSYPTRNGTVVIVTMKDIVENIEYYGYGYRNKKGQVIVRTFSKTNLGPNNKRAIDMNFAKWYARRYLISPANESLEMIATEGFLADWKAKRLSRKMDLGDINKLDQNIFCDLVGEYVADHYDLSYAIYDPVVAEKVFKMHAWYDQTERNKQLCPTPNTVVVKLGTKSIAIVSYYDAHDNQEMYAFAMADDWGYDASEPPTIKTAYDSNGKTSMSVERKSGNYYKVKPPRNQSDINPADCKFFSRSKKWWTKKLLRYYRKKYKKQTIGVADEAVTKFFERNFDPSEPLEPITLFGRLQDYAMESYRTSIADDPSISEIPYNALYRTTFQSGLPLLEKKFSLEEATESLLIAAEAINVPVDGPTREDFDKSMIISTVVYTVLETMKTLGLYQPNFNEVRRFVSSGTTYDDSVKMDIAKENVRKEVKAMESMVRSSKILDTTRADNAIEALDHCLEHLTMLEESGYKDVHSDIIAIEGLKTKIANKTRISDMIATESLVKGKEASLASAVLGMNKLNRYFGNKPNVTSIEIYYNSANEGFVNDVVVRGMKGAIVDKSFIDIDDSKVKGIAMESILKESYQKSDLASSSKPVKIIDRGQANKTTSLSD